jgi:AcrR family transcriptional regulator
MILVAAEELIVEKGLAQLRVRSIAAKIGYTVGSIYMVFDSMNDLIVSVKGRTLDALDREMSKKTDCSNPEQCLEVLAEVYINYAANNLNLWTMVFEHRLPEDEETPAWYQQKVDRLHRKFEKQFALMAPRLSSEQTKQAALAFLGGIHGICVFLLTGQLGGFNENDMEDTIALLVRRFIHDNWFHNVSANIVESHRSTNKVWGAKTVAT